MRILGIDPGSRLTGFGCIDFLGKRIRHISHGTIRLKLNQDEERVSFEDRLLELHYRLSQIIQDLSPQVMVVERVFFAKNASSALKLGQTRGAILLTGKLHSLEIFEYSPKEVKQAIVGKGQADKEQVAKMVQLLVGNQIFQTYDASDGLALAICHASCSRLAPKKALEKRFNIRDELFSKKKKKLSLAEAVGLTPVKKV